MQLSLRIKFKDSNIFNIKKNTAILHLVKRLINKYNLAILSKDKLKSSASNSR